LESALTAEIAAQMPIGVYWGKLQFRCSLEFLPVQKTGVFFMLLSFPKKKNHSNRQFWLQINAYHQLL
jgi:hypothetical protein